MHASHHKNEKSEKNELKIFGKNACLTIFSIRPQDIVRLYCTQEMIGQLKPLLAYLSQHKKTYHIVPSDELEQVAKSSHHEGICLIIKKKPVIHQDQLLNTLLTKKNLLILALDGVQNPHNLGAILRSSAHFNVDLIVLGNTLLEVDNAAAYRTSQGGVEYIPMIKVAHWIDFTAWCEKNKIVIFKTSGKIPTTKSNLPNNAISSSELLDAKSCIVFGSEGQGLSTYWNKINSKIITIQGSGLVESLNVSVAASILCAFYRQQFPINNIVPPPKSSIPTK